MNEHRPPDEVLNSASHTPMASVPQNRRPHTIARESWNATGCDFRRAVSTDTRQTKRSRRLDTVFSSDSDAASESQVQEVQQRSLPRVDATPAQQASDGGDRGTLVAMTPAQRAVDVGGSGNSTATTLTAPPPLWQTPVYETVMAVPPHKQFGMSKIRKPEHWQFIVLVAHYRFWNIDDKTLKNEHAAYAYCTRCKRSVRFSKGNSGVERHMGKYHAAALANYGKEDGVDENSLEPQPETQSRQLREVSPEQQKEVYVLLARWIAAHFRPLLLVEDKGFITFIKFITETICGIKLHLPGRTRLRADIVILAGDLRCEVKADISRSCTYYSITSDIWTARNARSYIAFTIHYVNDEFDFVSWTLEVKEIPGKHDADAIAAALEQIMDEWGLSKDLCCRFARDSGSNMVAAGNIMGTNHAACIAHELHLVVSGLISKKKKKDQSVPSWEALVSAEADVTINENEEDDELSEDDRVQMGELRDVAVDEMETFLSETLARLAVDEMATMRGIVQSFRTLVIYFRKSPKARTCLENIQKKQLGVPPGEVVTFKVDCPTRWNSCWDMLVRCIRLQPALNAFFVYLQSARGRVEFKDMQTKLTRPKDADWFAIKCLKRLLDPFDEATRTLGGQGYPTLPLVLPVLAGLRNKISQENLFEQDKILAGNEEYVNDIMVTMKECRNTVLRLFDKRFAHLSSTELTWVSYLDPRVAKFMNHLSDEQIPEARKNLITAAVQLARDEIEFTERGIFLSPEPAKKKVSSSFISTFVFGPDEAAIPKTTLKQDCSDEFTRYLADITAPKAVHKATNPCKWWGFHKKKYPNLSKLARKWLGIVATSVPSERAFSTSGSIITVKRGSLAPDFVRDIVFIAENTRRNEERGVTAVSLR